MALKVSGYITFSPISLDKSNHMVKQDICVVGNYTPLIGRHCKFRAM